MGPQVQTIDGVKETIQWVDHDTRSFYTHAYHSLQQPPLATILVVHGLGEHIDRYTETCRMFAKSGMEVLGFDQRGFGKTGQKSGTLRANEGIDKVSEDMAFFNRLVMQKDVPHFLYGNSMGGLNVLYYCLNHNQDGHVRGVVASAPALVPGEALKPHWLMGWMLTKIHRVWPGFKKATGITPDMLTSNQGEIERFKRAPENIGYCTLETLFNVLEGGNKVMQEAGNFNTPVYLVHADGDLATSCEGTQEFFSRVPEGVDKELKIIEDCAYHEPHYEEHLRVRDLYKQWILKHLINH